MNINKYFTTENWLLVLMFAVPILAILAIIFATPAQPRKVFCDCEQNKKYYQVECKCSTVTIDSAPLPVK